MTAVNSSLKKRTSKVEREEDLQCRGLKIIQDDRLYTFTSDSVVLANFVKIKKGEKAVEIGAGSGVISILLSAKMPVSKIYAFELQNEMASLAKRNVALNLLEDKIEVINDDIANFQNYVERAGFSVVFSNPPYMNSSNENAREVKAIARHDKFLSCEKLCKMGSALLKEKWRFYLCYPPERLCELFAEMSKCGLEPKRMFLTENNKKQIKLCFIEAVKGASHGLKILPNLTVNDADGKYLESLHTKYF